MEAQMDLVYSTHFLNDMKRSLAEAEQRDNSEFWIVLAASLAGAALTVLMLDPGAVATLAELATIAG
jgi:hypothetical protein